MKAFTPRLTALTFLALAITALPAAAETALKLRFGKLGPNLGMARGEIAET